MFEVIVSLTCVVTGVGCVVFKFLEWESEPSSHVQAEFGNPHYHVEDSDIFSATEKIPIHSKGNTWYGIRWNDRCSLNKVYYYSCRICFCLFVITLLGMPVITHIQNS